MLESIIKTDLTVGVFLICTAVSVALGIAVALVGMYRIGMHAELCDRACGASRGRADRYNARERKYRGGVAVAARSALYASAPRRETRGRSRRYSSPWR